MRGKSVHEVCQVLGALAGTLRVVVAGRRGVTPSGQPAAPRVLHVRAHFDYDPEDDVYIPCRELGKLYEENCLGGFSYKITMTPLHTVFSLTAYTHNCCNFNSERVN